MLFLIATHRDIFIDLYVDNFINISLNKEVDEIHEATHCYNVVTNVFDLFFKQNIDSLPNGLVWNCAISLRKLSGESTPDEIKKLLGWMVNIRLLDTGLPISKGLKWIAIINKFIEHRKPSAKDLEKLIG